MTSRANCLPSISLLRRKVDRPYQPPAITTIKIIKKSKAEPFSCDCGFNFGTKESRIGKLIRVTGGSDFVTLSCKKILCSFRYQQFRLAFNSIAEANTLNHFVATNQRAV